MREISAINLRRYRYTLGKDFPCFVQYVNPSMVHPSGNEKGQAIGPRSCGLMSEMGSKPEMLAHIVLSGSRYGLSIISCSSTTRASFILIWHRSQ